jgi:hypothetical protein
VPQYGTFSFYKKNKVNDVSLMCAAILMAVIAGIVFGYVWGKLNGRIEAEEEIDGELTELEQAVLENNQHIETMISATTPHLENSQRYQLVRYYLENDHGGLAINAFYGPGAITTALELDRMLDLDLDERNARLEIEALDELARDLNNKKK